MYPRNSASPPRLAIGPVVQISDGAVQTAGVSVKVIPQGGTEASGAGTVAYSADGAVLYTPTQGETDYVAVVFVASKTGCIPATLTVVMSASDVAGYAGLDWSKVGNATTTVALTGTTISTSQVVDSVSDPVTVGTNNDKTGYTLATSPPTAAAIADAVWDEAYSGHTTAGTFGKLMDTLRKSNTVLEGTILASPTPTTTVFKLSGVDYPTGALEHSVLWMNSGASQEQNSPILTTVNNGDGTITVTLEEALTVAPQAGDTVLIDPTSHVHAIADIQNGLATASALATLTGYVDTEVAAIKTVTDRISTGLVQDGAVWQFTVNMLENAPAGGGGGAGDASQATLLEVQDTVESIAASLSGVPITASGRIADGGTITLYCGDDLRVRSGSEIAITVSDVGGAIFTRLDDIGTANLFWGASRQGLPASAISGTIASLSQSGSGALQTLSIVVEIDNAGSSLKPAEDYKWQIESQQDHGAETDSVVEMEGLLSLRRRVV